MNKVSQNNNQSSLSLVIFFLAIIFASILVSGCMTPSFWLDDSDFQNNLPENSIRKYFGHWAPDPPEVRTQKLHTAYRSDFLQMFPIGDQVMRAKNYLMGIGTKCESSKMESEVLDTCIYRRKLKTYRGRGYLGTNRSFWAEKLLMYEGWESVIYKISSTNNSIKDIHVDTSSEPIYINTYTTSPQEKREIEKQIENCQPPECIRKF